MILCDITERVEAAAFRAGNAKSLSADGDSIDEVSGFSTRQPRKSSPSTALNETRPAGRWKASRTTLPRMKT